MEIKLANQSMARHWDAIPKITGFFYTLAGDDLDVPKALFKRGTGARQHVGIDKPAGAGLFESYLASAGFDKFSITSMSR